MGTQMNPIETHAKYLAWIDARREENRLRGNMFTNWIDPIKESSLSANRKVLELHAPNISGVECSVCVVPCFEHPADKVTFPCQTYTDITEGLGIPQ